VGYRTKCRFFRDSDQVDEIEWYPALPDAPLLGVPTVFASLRQEPRDFFWQPGGEVPFEPFTIQRPKTKPGALGVHHCGTDQDFAEGCAFLPLDPPVLYQTNGLPDCCGAVPAVRGGGAGGGRVGVVVSPPQDGLTCNTAFVLSNGVPRAYVLNSLLQRWFVLPTVPGLTNVAVQVTTDGSACSGIAFHGPCSALVVDASGVPTSATPWNASYTLSSPQPVRLSVSLISVGPAQNLTITVTVT
jgi:hypothetical protein